MSRKKDAKQVVVDFSVKFKDDVNIQTARQLLNSTPGITVLDMHRFSFGLYCECRTTLETYERLFRTKLKRYNRWRVNTMDHTRRLVTGYVQNRAAKVPKRWSNLVKVVHVATKAWPAV